MLPSNPDELSALLDARQADGWDFDALLSLGVRSSRDRDAAVIDWLKAAPSTERLDMACGLLWGLWSAGPPPEERAAAFLDASDGVPLDTQTAYDLAVTLTKLLGGRLTEPIRARIAARMAAVTAARADDPMLDSLLQSLEDAM